MLAKFPYWWTKQNWPKCPKNVVVIWFLFKLKLKLAQQLKLGAFTLWWWSLLLRLLKGKKAHKDETEVFTGKMFICFWARGRSHMLQVPYICPRLLPELQQARHCRSDRKCQLQHPHSLRHIYRPWLPAIPTVSIVAHYPACVWLCAAMCFKILLVLLNYVGCSRKWPVNCPSAVGAATAGLCCLSVDPSADIVGLPESASVSSHTAQQQHHTLARIALAS